MRGIGDKRNVTWPSVHQHTQVSMRVTVLAAHLPGRNAEVQGHTLFPNAHIQIAKHSSKKGLHGTMEEELKETPAYVERGKYTCRGF